jgi:hypothetical protein
VKLPPTAMGVVLSNLGLGTPEEITAAWNLASADQTLMVTLPWELKDAKDRIQLAAAEHGLLLNRC